MRRSLAAGTLAGAALALMTACGTGPIAGGATAGPSAGSGAAGPAASAAGPGAARSPSRDPVTAANTHQVCGAINRAVTEGAAAFGTDLGSMVGHLAGRNQAGAQAARASALHRLSALAGTVRTAAAPALDPAVRAAGEATASNLDRVAADPGLLAGVKAAADMTSVLGRVTASTDPMTNVCA